MYKSFTKKDFIEKLSLGGGYEVSGFIIYGTYASFPYELTEEIVKETDSGAVFKKLSHEFLSPILEFTIKDKKYWFVIAYGGALLCEWAHIACLLGSKINILLGNCGGLFAGANTSDILVPTFSFANESTTRAYEPNSENKHYADQETRKNLAKELEKTHIVWEGPTITYEAMLAETWEDIQRWSKEGYYGVEMEAATVFAVSNYFKVPSAAILQIGDNLIKEETVFDINYEKTRDMRGDVSRDMFKAALKKLL